MTTGFNPRIRFVDDKGYLTREAAQMLGFTDPGQGFQPSDATLTALANLNATPGILAQTGADAFSKRTLEAPAAGLTITNPAGAGGNPVFALANDLEALEAVTGTGFAARTATDTWAARTLAAPAAGLTITNPAGVAGNPTFALANDLAAVEGLSGTGFAVRTAADTWTIRTIAGTTPVSVSNGDGVSGNPTVSVSAASETASGVVELATDAETVTGTSTTLATHPSGVAAAIAAAGLSVSSGTWTPTLTTNGTNFDSVTYDAVTAGNYVTFGGIVFIVGRLRTDAVTIGSATGNILIGGLPFTAGGAPDATIAISNCQSWLGEEPLAAAVQSGATTMILFYRGSVSGGISLNVVSDVGTGANANECTFSGFYFT